MIWSHEITLERTRTQLRRLDRMAMLAMASIRRSTPTEALYIIYDLIPTELFVKYTAVKSFIRQRSVLKLDWVGKNKNKTFSISYLKALELRTSELGLDDIELDKTNTRMWGGQAMVDEASLHLKAGASQSKDGSHYYTDGSLIENRPGA